MGIRDFLPTYSSFYWSPTFGSVTLHSLEITNTPQDYILYIVDYYNFIVSNTGDFHGISSLDNKRVYSSSFAGEESLLAQTAITRKHTALNRAVVLTVLWTATLDMFSNSMRRTGFFLCKQDYGGIRCLTSVFCTRTTSTLIGGDKQKTIDDLDGPSILTSLYWLFGKGYFQTTHQMQVNIHKKVLGRTLWISKRLSSLLTGQLCWGFISL